MLQDNKLIILYCLSILGSLSVVILATVNASRIQLLKEQINSFPTELNHGCLDAPIVSIGYMLNGTVTKLEQTSNFVEFNEKVCQITSNDQINHISFTILDPPNNPENNFNVQQLLYETEVVNLTLTILSATTSAIILASFFYHMSSSNDHIYQQLEIQ